MRQPSPDYTLAADGSGYDHPNMDGIKGNPYSVLQSGTSQGYHFRNGKQDSSGLIGAMRQTHALSQVMLHAHAAVEDWRMQLCVGTGFLLAFAVTMLYMRTRNNTRTALHVRIFTRSVFLTMSIAASWVGTSQFAQGAKARSKGSVTLLLVWANGTAWVFLAIPYLVHRLWQRDSAVIGHPPTSRLSSIPSSSASSSSMDRFETRHVVMFFLIALFTNSAYFAALRFMSASLHTAVFSTTSIFTFFLTLLVLKSDPASISTSSRRLRAICIAFSVLGVVLISGFSNSNSDEQHVRSLVERLIGLALSLTAALGTAVYQVVFKFVFGNRMSPVMVGFFLAHLGAMVCVCYGSLLFGGIASGLVNIDLFNVPWDFVLLAAMSGMAFNFLLKFGIISTSPISVSLATQFGIPLNLGVDLLIVRAKIEPLQMLGVFIMFLSLTVNSYLDRSNVKTQE